ncbi:MAG: hypothetical protein K0S65_3007 [Labilithrix sp.]|nr:hypothetical protein [Labilithrix sp.]
MIRIRHTGFALVVLTSGALTVLACTSSEARPDFLDAAAPDSGTASPPEQPPPTDGGAQDAPDARPPFNPADEAVVCATEPCAVDLVAGQNHFCVLMSDKSVRCWGDNSKGSLGAPSPTPDEDSDAGAPFVVSKVDGLEGVAQIGAAGSNTCALRADGSVACWGGNDRGQLGLSVDPPTKDYEPHVAASEVALSGIASRIDVGQTSSCAILSNGEVHCWGANEQGQLARPPNQSFDAYGGPAKVDGLPGKIVRTAAGTNTGFAIDDKGQIYSWGAVAGLEGSVGGRISSMSPDLLPGLFEVGPISSFAVSSWEAFYPPFDGNDFPPPEGVGHACVIVSGDLRCWGDTVHGALGVGKPGLAIHPLAVVVASDAYPQQVAVSHENTCVRLTDGTVQCVGDDSHGQLGRDSDAGVFKEFFAPVVSFKEHAVRVALSDTTTCALVQGGTVSCWGGNEHGELGQGTADTGAHGTPVTVRLR